MPADTVLLQKNQMHSDERTVSTIEKFSQKVISMSLSSLARDSAIKEDKD